ncbi:ABC transporter substrate-binding protein [Natronococcus sp. A-GB7]|uniref:ABC transporter substrate-binding protein n=1 Tax=Natronococcus sp. A-GB7 TaxID=3037649 RepID=UPI00241C8567|nr:ABC transporter substrate-binding protein [Natronococcus sp. A-GB7]MDG5820236.1 ABC transporter substrate-binding protein [Natronococcus sp. A-GB7]
MGADNKSRRDVLQIAGGTASVGVIAGLAGCMGDSGTEGAGEPIDTIELIVTTADYDPVRYEFGQLIAEHWEELGLDVEVNPMAWNQIVDTAMDGQDFDTFTLNWAGRAERLDPDVFCYDLHHSSQTDEGQRNNVNYVSEEYDEYAEAQRRALDEDERQEAVHRCQEIFAEDQPRTPIANQTQAMPYHAERFDEVVTMMGEGLMSFWTAVETVPADGVDTLRLGYPSDVNNLNPNDGSATHDQQTMRLIYDRLARIDQDGFPEPWLATEIEAVDETTYEVTIRDDQQWHDGEDLTIDDVVFSFEYLDEHSPVLGAVTDPIESVEAIDDWTVEFVLEEPYAPFEAVTLGQVFIIPQHIWEDVPDELDDVERPADWENPEPVGSGPFEFVEWRRDEEMRLEAFDDHFSPPEVDELIKVPGADVSGLVRLLEDEEIDMIGWVPGPDTVNRLDDDVDHVDISAVDDPGWYHINYHNEREPFTDPEFRRALADAIPKQDIVDVVLDGMGTVTHSPIAEVNEFWHNPDVTEYGDDLGGAQQRLEEAGYVLADGRLHYPEE